LGEGFPEENTALYRSRSFCPELQPEPVITDLFHHSAAAQLLGSVIDLARIQPVNSGQIALRFPTLQSEPSAASPHLDVMHSPLNGVPEGTIANFTALVGVLLSDLPHEHAGNFTVWPGSHHKFE